MILYLYALMCGIWFIHNVRTRNIHFNNLERVLIWTLFIPVTLLILITDLVLAVVGWRKERS